MSRRRPDAWPVSFGISWNRPVDRGTQGFSLLDSLGFPWILSSESIFFNGLRGALRKNFFEGDPPWRRRRRSADARSWHAEGPDCSCGEFSSVSDFVQSVAEAVTCACKSSSL